MIEKECYKWVSQGCVGLKQEDTAGYKGKVGFLSQVHEKSEGS